MVPRTEGVSTTALVGRMLKLTKEVEEAEQAAQADQDVPLPIITLPDKPPSSHSSSDDVDNHVDS